ncbi:MAG: hypothetical protein ACK5X3_16580 [Pseudomonadota bacterium]|jgi:hypothetical protein
MTNEELDKARGAEALRLYGGPHTNGERIAIEAARLAREGWTPPEPVDPDLLAFMEWATAQGVNFGFGGLVDAAYLAGARMATERERERAKVLLDYAWEDAGAPGKTRSDRAFDIIQKHEKGPRND